MPFRQRRRGQSGAKLMNPLGAVCPWSGGNARLCSASRPPRACTDLRGPASRGSSSKLSVVVRVDIFPGVLPGTKACVKRPYESRHSCAKAAQSLSVKLSACLRLRSAGRERPPTVFCCLAPQSLLDGRPPIHNSAEDIKNQAPYLREGVVGCHQWNGMEGKQKRDKQRRRRREREGKKKTYSMSGTVVSAHITCMRQSRWHVLSRH